MLYTNKKTRRYYFFMALIFMLYNEYSYSSNQDNADKNSKVNFDIDSLKALGYGEEVADYFMQGSQFLPGNHDVTIQLNGDQTYSVNAKIDDSGHLCLDDSLQKTLRLKSTNLEDGCHVFQDVYPDSRVVMRPNEFAIDITVAENNFDPKLLGRELTYGGFGLVNNYRIYGMHINGHNNQEFYQGEFETGANWNNWVLRNNSSFSSSKGNSEYQFNETVLSRSIESLKSQFEIGQLNSRGSCYSGIPVNGIQLYSDSALQLNNRLVVPIAGFANSPSTVEVQQNGRLLYRTIVPAGPFEINRINNIINGTPVDLTVIQDNGERQKYQVMTSNQATENLSPLSYQFFIGKYRTVNSVQESDNPLISSLEASAQYKKIDYSAGALYSDKYQSVSGGVHSSFGEKLLINGGGNVSISRNDEKEGSQLDFNTSLAKGAASLGVSFLYRSHEYPTLDSTLEKQQPILDEDAWNLPWFSRDLQTSSSLYTSWGDINWGSFSYSLNYNHYYGDGSDTVSHLVGYSRKIGDVSLNLSFQSGTDQDNRFYLNASIPINSRSSASIQSQYYDDRSTLMANYNYRQNDRWNYSIGAGRSSDVNRVNGSINNTNAYTQLSLNASMTENNVYSFMSSATGAIAYSNGLVATSSVPLSNTFGIIYIPNQPNVKVSALGSGSTITNHFGTAAISSLPTNRKTTVQLNTQDLPLNIRLDTTSFDVAVARGSVITKEIKATEMRQLLLSITLKNGQKAPSGASLINKKGKYVSAIMGEGNTFLTNEQIGDELILRSPNSDDCIVKYTVPEHFSSELLYEEVDAICQ
ncbi:fimbria/pilus outer membrane usher protein [Providencia stuartii]|uniref:fimbria/pilus outer membrane usher protein n=1 Tax=Providencia stuartii TaxID=588 RepID=UPI001E5CE1AC|nr:fimbria/pilus outer membrane usher protein [Providencia stuartii]